jgi:hypothetical protein
MSNPSNTNTTLTALQAHLCHEQFYQLHSLSFNTMHVYFLLIDSGHSWTFITSEQRASLADDYLTKWGKLGALPIFPSNKIVNNIMHRFDTQSMSMVRSHPLAFNTMPIVATTTTTFDIMRMVMSCFFFVAPSCNFQSWNSYCWRSGGSDVSTRTRVGT